MFNLESSITEWRRQMLAAGVKSPNVLAELESHLRADIRALEGSGKAADEAFRLAIQRFGSAGSLQSEFAKLSRKHIWPVKIGFLVLAAGVFLQPIGILSGAMHLIGAGQFILIVVGYLAAFLAGNFGICRVCFQACHALTPVRQQSLNRAINLFSLIAALLVLLAFVLGWIWVRDHPAQFARSERFPYAIGNGCMCLWLMALVALQQFGCIRSRTNSLLAIVGGTMVLLASYPRILIQALYGELGGHWFFAMIILVHACFLILAFARWTELRPSSD